MTKRNFLSRVYTGEREKNFSTVLLSQEEPLR